MFQKLVRSVFLDKGGREALEKSERLEERRVTQGPSQGSGQGSGQGPGKGPGKGPSRDLAADAASSLAKSKNTRASKEHAKAQAEAELQMKANATELERSTIREALDAAHQEIMSPANQARRRNGGKDSVVSAASHEQLVESAMTIFRHKQSVLGDLDPEARKKLRLMAQTLFNAKTGQ